MYGTCVGNADINQLISELISRHCDDARVARVIRDVLREVLFYQHHKPTDSDKRFRKRYKELILANFEVGSENA